MASSELNKALEALGIEEPQSGPRGGKLYETHQPEGRVQPHNMEMTAAGTLALHRFSRDQDVARTGIKNEQPWHRFAAHMIIAGKSRLEIAEAAGVSPDTVSNLRAQRWFQDLLVELATEHGEAVVKVLQSEALASVEKLVSLRDTAESERVQLAAAQMLLEQANGKPTQRVISDTTVRRVDPQTEAKELRDEIGMLLGHRKA